MLRVIILAPACYPINIGSGKAISIKKLAKTILKIRKNIKISWDKNRPSG